MFPLVAEYLEECSPSFGMPCIAEYLAEFSSIYRIPCRIFTLLQNTLQNVPPSCGIPCRVILWLALSWGKLFLHSFIFYSGTLAEYYYLQYFLTPCFTKISDYCSLPYLRNLCYLEQKNVTSIFRNFFEDIFPLFINYIRNSWSIRPRRATIDLSVLMKIFPIASNWWNHYVNWFD